MSAHQCSGVRVSESPPPMARSVRPMSVVATTFLNRLSPTAETPSLRRKSTSERDHASPLVSAQISPIQGMGATMRGAP